MTNEERAVAKLKAFGIYDADARCYVAALKADGLLATEPEPRYRLKADVKEEGQYYIGDGVLVYVRLTQHATEAMRAAVLSALNALPEGK